MTNPPIRIGSGLGAPERYGGFPEGRRAGRDHRRDFGAVDQLLVDVHAEAGRITRFRQRCICKPTSIRTRAHDQAHPQHDAGEEVQIIAKCIRTRERYIAGADHQGDKVNTYTEHDRNGEQEHHRHAVDGKELVILVWIQEVVFRHGKLRPHQQSRDPCQSKEQESCHDIACADIFMIARRQPADQTRTRLP